PHTPGELVAYELFRPLQDLCARLVDGHRSDPLQFGELLVLCRLQLLLKLAGMHLAVGDPLLAAVELGHLSLEIPLARYQARLRPGEPRRATAAAGVSPPPTEIRRSRRARRSRARRRLRDR